MDNKTKAGLFIVAALALLVIVLMGSNWEFLGLAIGGPKQNTCADTDGGINAYVQGTVSGQYNRQVYSYTDACSDSTRLKEYYCKSNVRSSQSITCLAGYSCQSGVCSLDNPADTTTTLATTTTTSTVTTIITLTTSTTTTNPTFIPTTTTTLPSSGSVVQFRFDESSGLIASDSSGNANHGALLNGPSWAVGVSGSSILFDGVDSYVDAGSSSSLDITGPVTIMAWVNPSTAQEICAPNTGGNRGVASKVTSVSGSSGYSWQLRFGAPTTCYLGFQFNDPVSGSRWVTVGQALSPGQWYHVAATFDGSTVRSYLNGAVKESNTMSSIQSNPTFKLLIGSDGWANYFAGRVDDFRIYGRALSASEISQIYSALATTTTTSTTLAPSTLPTTTTTTTLPNSCSDSDGGGGLQNYYKGNVSGVSNGVQYFYSDACLNSTLVTEYYCQNNLPLSQQMVCPVNDPCIGGRCVTTTSTTTTTMITTTTRATTTTLATTTTTTTRATTTTTLAPTTSTTAATTTTTTLSTAFSVAGSFESATCDYVTGWACNRGNYSSTLYVEYYMDGPAGTGTYLGEFLAGNTRTDISSQCGGYANHGFAIPTHSSLKNGASHTIYVYAINRTGNDPMLTGSPRTIQCATTTTTTTTQQGTTTTTRIATGAIIIDHTSTNIDKVPAAWINKAKSDFKVTYGHTSHGSQVVTGMGMLSSSLLAYSTTYPGTPTTGVLSLWDKVMSGETDLGNPNVDNWYTLTVNHLNGVGADRNVVIWSWCGELSVLPASSVNTYLAHMESLEAQYPNKKFIYMTGHLYDGVTGSRATLTTNNNIIRDYCRAHNKILFDFADIENYDPNGVFYSTETDACNWCTSWCSTHTCPTCTFCAHSHCFNCYQKGKAFWWMMARMAGWDGVSTT